MATEQALSETRNIFTKTLFKIAETEINLTSLIIFLTVIFCAIGFSILLQKVLSRALQKKFSTRIGTLTAVLRLLHYSIVIVGIVFGMEVIGIEISSLFAAGAVFALAIGFAMQNVILNFVSGVILLLERSIKPGDVLEVEGIVVKVIEMGIRTTVVRTWREEDLIMPNAIFSQATVKNFTLRDPEFRIQATVGVCYDSDMHKVREVLEATAENVEWRLSKMAPRVLLKEFGSSSVDFGVSVGIDDPWNQNFFLSELRTEIWFALKDAGITIAYPQLDLHLDSRALELLTQGKLLKHPAGNPEVESLDSKSQSE